ncbi:hypothetical protein HU200_062144 [Digitaria exilis]|uniref:F-box domain-containing protein n=1 Tax=Digitaria exilis TaxID=1010633 RepID=A0A835AGP7_9POAL|nr:hypothetical protein HU200_062144 [Digitaria exilis]
MAASSSPAVVIGTAVFQPGPHRVDTKHVDQSQVPSVPKPVMVVVTPTDAGTYPVAVFLHGCNLVNSWYESLLTHVASHGFIAVAPQLYGVALNLNDLKDIDATRLVAAWLADKDQGLAHVLTDVLGLHGVKPDISRHTGKKAAVAAPTIAVRRTTLSDLETTGGIGMTPWGWVGSCVALRCGVVWVLGGGWQWKKPAEATHRHQSTTQLAAVSHLASRRRRLSLTDPPEQGRASQTMVDMPPPPRPRASPALPDELVEAILLRSPPDDPARLVHAALVCKRWCRLVSGRSFRRRFRARRPAPMLGFLSNDAVGDGGFSARFVHTAASCPPLAGRVLLHHRAAAAALGIRLAVWDPLASAQHQHMVDLPSPVLPRRPRSWNAVLRNLVGYRAGEWARREASPEPGNRRRRARARGEHLLDRIPFLSSSSYPMYLGAFVFRVVLVGTDAEGAFACVYSEPSQQQHPGDDLATRAMTVLHLPPVSHNQRIALTATEGGGLGFARMEGYRLGLWSSMDDGGAMEWTRDREIYLRTLLPVIDLLGFAHGVFLVGTVDGFFSVDQNPRVVSSGATRAAAEPAASALSPAASPPRPRRSRGPEVRAPAGMAVAGRFSPAPAGSHTLEVSNGWRRPWRRRRPARQIQPAGVWIRPPGWWICGLLLRVVDLCGCAAVAASMVWRRGRCCLFPAAGTSPRRRPHPPFLRNQRPALRRILRTRAIGPLRPWAPLWKTVVAARVLPSFGGTSSSLFGAYLSVSYRQRLPVWLMNVVQRKYHARRGEVPYLRTIWPRLVAAGDTASMAVDAARVLGGSEGELWRRYLRRLPVGGVIWLSGCPST